MNYLTLENITKSYGEKTLFRNVNLQVNKGQKVALIAKNGSGKTTLMRVIAGTEPGEGENAKIQLRKEIRIGYLPQEPEFHPSHNALDAVFDSDTETIKTIRRYELALLHPNDEKELQAALSRMDDLKAWDYESKVKEILFKLNITNLEQSVTTLSGGQKKRLALAKLLIEEPDFLILDEPTNHLDLDMIEWLEVYLKQPNLTLFMVTHDRYFMERICDNILELDRGELYKYTGGYKDFLEKRALRMENESIELDKTQKVYKKELEWMRRSPKARTTKANARIERFDDIEDKASKRLDNDNIQIEIKGQRLGGKILELHYVSKGYGDLKLVSDFHYKFKKGEKVGIVGKNGVGKTTFLHMLTGEERPDTGKVVSGETVVFGYYTQEGLNLGDTDKRVIDFIKDIAEYIPLDKGQKLTAASLLERFLFTREQQQVYISQLSGGERRRLYLLSILMKNPNFLILDEPTNDLDVMTLNVLEEWLQEFPGCVVIVSHDRFLLDKLCDHLFVFEGDGQIKDYNGRYMDYRAEQLELAQELRQQTPTKRPEEKSREQMVRTESGLTNKEKNELKKLEREIADLETRKTQLHEKFAQPDLSLPDINKMTKDLQRVESDLEEKEMRWLELSDM
ncbi:MAG: ABC-F family ATP-binding cassette domain-containing protein [Saprospiraceae bacterium]|nr:ABC-F family ATP-binding cassette domain-containing protein [Saprospiraceae bacterium]MCF8249107.1 ABC-F family ATP-binding cassette domain-containing protein [Saprospiraceae bacterium]MCF8311129.1 ABC-F family ATP-binding cassette domain-containing protein [Saprospiraceae bacterium]MCF8440219.1 ABC-F family ATP-binding cassette domain-containing protein [Saprospiraceae bacterium]